MLKLLIVISYFLLSACVMVGPDYEEPKTKVASHWLHEKGAVKKGLPRDAHWWETFQDPTLTALIYQGYGHNLSLQIAGVHVLQMRAQLAQSVGELYPQQQALVGNYTDQRIGGSSLQNLLPPTFKTASLGFSASWEFDFWGKYRRAIQSNDAAFLASLSAYDNALVTLTSDVASTYISVRTYETLIKITKQNIDLQTKSFKIARSRFKAGETSLLDVEQAQTELAETEASLPTLVSSLQHQKDLLAVLLGVPPDEIDRSFLKEKKPIPKAPPSVAVAIPRETLAQRPDIYQARMETMAQLATIGATKANLFPSLSLMGNFNFASNNIGNNSTSEIFQWSNRTYSIGPSVTWPLLNYGQITNAVRMQDAVFQQSLLNYQNVVLKAQQEVQDNITRYIEAQKSEVSLVKANQSAIQSTKLALIRYEEGESDYTTVLDAERQQLRVQTSLVNAQGDISQALVALYRALGGGWQIRGSNDIVPKELKEQMGKRTNWGNLLDQKNHEQPTTQWGQIKQDYLPTW